MCVCIHVILMMCIFLTAPSTWTFGDATPPNPMCIYVGYFLSFTVLNYRIHIDGYALMELFIHLAGAKKHCCQVFFLATRQLQSVVSSHQAHQAQAATIQ